MNSIHNYLSQCIFPGNYSVIYQSVKLQRSSKNIISVYINCEPIQPDEYAIVEQVKLSTNMIFRVAINICIDRLYFACTCVDRCMCNCIPPRFAGFYEIYDRKNIISKTPLDEYYKLSGLARFDHRFLTNLAGLSAEYGVLFWVVECHKSRGIILVEDDYANGVPIYNVEDAKRVIVAFSDPPMPIKFLTNKLDFSKEFLSLIELARNINAKKIKVIINL